MWINVWINYKKIGMLNFWGTAPFLKWTSDAEEYLTIPRKLSADEHVQPLNNYYWQRTRYKFSSVMTPMYCDMILC